MEDKEVKNPFEKLFEQMAELKLKQQCLMDDITVGNLDMLAVERSNQALLNIKNEIADLNKIEKLLQAMSQKTKKEHDEEIHTCFKQLLPPKHYLLLTAVRCKKCGIISVLTNKVAYIINDLNDSAVEAICENCYLIQKEKLERANQKQAC